MFFIKLITSNEYVFTKKLNSLHVCTYDFVQRSIVSTFVSPRHERLIYLRNLNSRFCETIRNNSHSRNISDSLSIRRLDRTLPSLKDVPQARRGHRTDTTRRVRTTSDYVRDTRVVLPCCAIISNRLKYKS